MLILESPWTRQPQGNVPAARHELTPRWLWTASSGLYTPERLAGTLPTNAGGSVAPTINGVAYVGAAGSGNGLSFGTARQAIPSNSTTHTILCFAAPVAGATGARQSLFTQGDDGGAPYTQYALLADAGTSSGVYSSGNLTYAHYDNAQILYTYTAGGGFIDGAWHVFCAVRSGTAAALYRDGALLASTGSGAGGAGTNATTGAAIISGAQGSSRVCTGPNALVATWDRALSAAEVAYVSQNVWQLFAPQQIIIPTPAAAAVVPTLSASTYVPGSMTSTGWRPQITAS